MRALHLAAALTMLASPLVAQDGQTALPIFPSIEISPIDPETNPQPQIEVMPLDDGVITLEQIETEQLDPVEQRLAVTAAPGGVLRLLDRVSGQLRDMALENGQTATEGHLSVTLGECRFPTDNPASDAFAFVTITDDRQSEPLFRGWMVASSPALNALDHPRYDIWVMRCIRS